MRDQERGRQAWCQLGSEGQEDDSCKNFRARWGGLCVCVCVCARACVCVAGRSQSLAQTIVLWFCHENDEDSGYSKQEDLIPSIYFN